METYARVAEEYERVARSVLRTLEHQTKQTKGFRQLLAIAAAKRIVECLGATRVLSNAHLTRLSLPYARIMFEVLVTLEYISADESEGRLLAYIGAGMVKVELEAEAMLEGSPEFAARNEMWRLAVGDVRIEDQQDLQQKIEQLKGPSGDELLDEARARYREYARGKVRFPSWSAPLGAKSILDRIRATRRSEELTALYRTLYAHQSSDLHADQLLDGVAKLSADGNSVQLVAPFEWSPEVTAVALDSVLGTSAVALDFMIATYLSNDEELREQLQQAQIAKREALSK
jgi:hypothetical protein